MWITCLFWSAQGEGDPPETATDFCSALMGETAPQFAGTNYSVLGLGDTSYEHFCKMGKDFDARLEALGANRVFARKDCDVDFDSDFEEWLDGSLSALLKLQPEVAASAVVSPAAPTQTAVKYSARTPSLLHSRNVSCSTVKVHRRRRSTWSLIWRVPALFTKRATL